MLNELPVMLGFIAGYSLQDIATAILKNLPTLAWVLLVPYMLYKNSQGRELLTSMFDDADRFTGVRAAAILPLFHLIALALFFVPTAIFPHATPEELIRLRPVTKDLTPAVIACSLPMVFYGLVMYIVQLKRFRRWWTLAPVAALLVGAGYGVSLMLKGPRLPLWLLDVIVVANMLLVFALISMIRKINLRRRGRNRPPVSVLWNYFAVGICMGLQLILIAGSLRQSEWLFFNARDVYNVHYLLMLITTTVLIVAAAWAPNLQPLSPTFVLLGITLFYLLLGDLLSASFLLLDTTGKYILSGLLAVFAYLMFFHRSRIHDVRLWPGKFLSGVRVDLDTYFQAWWDTNIAPELTVETDKNRKIPIFLMAIQGGGSRAGYWTSQLLNRLNLETGGRFRRHLFAATSASGGSSGFGATLAMWRFLEDNPDLSEAEKTKIQEGFARSMYARNYLSGAFYQIFVGEIGARIMWFFNKKRNNRNFTQRTDEAVAFGEAIQQGLESVGPQPRRSFFKDIRMRVGTFFKRGDKDPVAKSGNREIPNYPIRPYLSYWYRDDRTPDARLPLYFPITLNIQTGRAGFSSPVKMNRNVFIDAIDIVAESEKEQDPQKGWQSLSLVGASQFSQLFPMMNAYTYIPGVGNFIDGGLFENHGFTLMCRLYDWLQKKVKTLDASVKDRVDLQLVFVVNGNIRHHDSLGERPKPEKRISQISAIMRAVGFAGISGRTTWWGDFLRDQIQPAQTTEIILQYPNFPVDKTQHVPLGRWLSGASVERMRLRLEGIKNQQEPSEREKWEKLVEMLK